MLCVGRHQAQGLSAASNAKARKPACGGFVASHVQLLCHRPARASSLPRLERSQLQAASAEAFELPSRPPSRLTSAWDALCALLGAVASRVRRRSSRISFTIAVKIAVNVAAVVALALMEAVPLWPGDVATLGLQQQQIASATAILSRGQLPQTLHPFMLSVAPFVQANIIVQTLSALPVMPRPLYLPLEIRTTLYGQQLLRRLGRKLGTFFAVVMGLLFAAGMWEAGICTLREVPGITLALAAGSSICNWLADTISFQGVGEGVSFMYTVAIASGLQAQVTAVLQQGLPPAMLAKIAAPVMGIVVCCAIIVRARCRIKLQALSVGSRQALRSLSEEERPRLTLLMCPFSTLVLIGVHFVTTMIVPLTTIWGRAAVAFCICAMAQLPDIKSTIETNTRTIRQMDMIVEDVGPGEATKAYLFPLLLYVRILGGVALFGLYLASLVLDAWLLQVAGVQASVVEFLILVGTLAQATRLFGRAAAELGTQQRMQHLFGVFHVCASPKGASA